MLKSNFRIGNNLDKTVVGPQSTENILYLSFPWDLTYVSRGASSNGKIVIVKKESVLPASCFLCHFSRFSTKMSVQGRKRTLLGPPEPIWPPPICPGGPSSGREAALFLEAADGGMSNVLRMRSTVSPKTVKVGRTM